MADRIPLIVNPTASQIQELPNQDDLVLSGELKMTGTTLGGSDIHLSGGSDSVAVIGVTGTSGTLSQLRIDCQKNDNSGDLQVAEFNVGASDAIGFVCNGTINVQSSDASTNKTSGALVVTGGVGVGGALNVGGDITAFATSDKNLKENLVAIPNALDKVGIITGYTYKWKTAGTDYSSVDGVEDTGVIAQDVEVLGLPGITTTREDGTKAISYKRLTPLLIQAIKELKKENDDLKTLIKDSTSFQNLRSSL